MKRGSLNVSQSANGVEITRYKNILGQEVIIIMTPDGRVWYYMNGKMEERK